MKKENIVLKDRETTEKRILDAVGYIILEEGFEKIGVNAVAQRAAVSKMLIYRYFGGVEELIARYIFQKDYWINISIESDKIQDVNKFLKTIFRKQILLLREDIIIKRLYRWELSINNSMINEIRAKRESNGCQLVDIISKLTIDERKKVYNTNTFKEFVQIPKIKEAITKIRKVFLTEFCKTRSCYADDDDL